MNTKSKTALGIVLFAAFLGIAYFAYGSLSSKYKPMQDTQSSQSTPSTQASQSASSEAEKKTHAPDFTVYDAQGKKVKLSDFKGKPVVLNFWASWCPPCKGEMPHFNKEYANVKSDVVFMMVDLVDNQRETQAIGKKYVEDQGFTLPVYFDNEQQAASAYGISSIPDTLFIDTDGNIVSGYQGAIDEGTLISGIDSIKKK